MGESRRREHDLDLGDLDLHGGGVDFLREMREVCRLHLAKDPATRDADITELSVAPGGIRLDHLVVSYRRGPWEERFVVGAYEGRVTADVLELFRTTICQAKHNYTRAELVQRFGELDHDLLETAAAGRIWLRSWAEYQRVWDHAPYVRRQSEDLRADLAYPLGLHIDKQWAPLGEQGAWGDTALRRILDWLATDGPRFVLVLGDFGTGKTFLMHALADELAAADGLAPVLVTMRDLEKGRNLDELLAQHMSKHGEDPFHLRSFRYLLRQGRVALLFDGFDELALRTSFERVPHHFATLRQAAEGAAKIVVTSRHQYFATDQAVRNALGADIEALPGSRTIRLFPLTPKQRRAMVAAAFDGAGAEADRFLDILGRVRGLLELATNARMLSFLIRWFRDGVLTEEAIAGAGTDAPMTRGRLYELLLTEWLEYERQRQIVAGSHSVLSVDDRLAALGEVAQRLWDTGDRSVHPADLGELAERVADLTALEMGRGEAAQAMASSTVFVRLPNDEFAFIHQSVMEWFVAWRARAALAAGRDDDALAHRELTGVVVDFLCDLAGDDAVVAWARQTAAAVEAPGAAAKANAALILQQRNVTAAVANYARQDLRGRDLSRQDLTGAQLAGADLAGAVLPRAMRGANLRGARLVGAWLDRADLAGADLTGADLTRARLVGADLRGAALAGTVLDRASLLGASLAAGTLSGASTFGAALPDAVLQPQTVASSPVRAAVTLRNGELLATAHGPSIVISDAGTGRQLRTLSGPGGEVLALAVAPDGSWLAAAGEGGGVRLWDPGSGRELRSLSGSGWGVLALAVAPDGSWLAAGGDGGVVRLWEPGSGRELRSLRHAMAVRALAVAPDGSWLAAGGGGGGVRLWEPGSGRELRSLRHAMAVRALAVAPDGSWLAAAGGGGVVRLWDPGSGRELRSLSGSGGWVWALAVAPDGSWLAAGDSGGGVRLWDPGSGRELRSLSGSGREVWALAVAPDGSWLAAGDSGGGVRLWDPGSGRELRSLSGSGGEVWALVVAPDGSWLAAADDDGQVRLWHPRTGDELAVMIADREGWVMLLPDGSFKLGGRPDSVWWAAGLCRFDPHELAELAEFQPHLKRLDDDVRILP